MDLPLYKKIIKDIPHKLEVLWLHKDGEPLLNIDIAELVKIAKENNKTSRVEIYTNGVLLNEKTSEDLIKAKLDSLVISLDAIDEIEYLKLKGKDEYQKILKNINNFLEMRKRFRSNIPILTIKTIEMDNKDNQEKFISFWRRKAENVIVQPMHEWEGSIKILNSKKQIANSKRYACNLPWLSPAITWDGKVMPCCVNYEENELVMGDLNKNNLVEIYQGTKYKELRRAHLDKDFSKYPTCQKCTFWKQLPNMEYYLRFKI